MLFSTFALGLLSVAMAAAHPSAANRRPADDGQITLSFCATSWEPLGAQQAAGKCDTQPLNSGQCYDIRGWRAADSRNCVFVPDGRTCVTNSAEHCPDITGGQGTSPPWAGIGPDPSKPGLPWQAKLDGSLDVASVYCT
jgi:hypothetical protein